MSAPVDVLAMLKKEADYSGCLGPRAAEARTKRLMQVHAAVAELFDKADNAATALSNLIAAGQVDAGYSVYVTELCAALARVHPMTREQQAAETEKRA